MLNWADLRESQNAILDKLEEIDKLEKQAAFLQSAIEERRDSYINMKTRLEEELKQEKEKTIQSRFTFYILVCAVVILLVALG